MDSHYQQEIYSFKIKKLLCLSLNAIKNLKHKPMDKNKVNFIGVNSVAHILQFVIFLLLIVLGQPHSGILPFHALKEKIVEYQIYFLRTWLCLSQGENMLSISLFMFWSRKHKFDLV